MSEIKVMVVPGKIVRIDLMPRMTVLDACEAAERLIPGVNWVGLAKDREVRVQNRKYSNSNEVPEGYFGSIVNTPLNDGEVVLILTKIKGNAAAPGVGVIICSVDGQEYALETPDTLKNILVNVVGYKHLSLVKALYVNGERSPLDQLVGGGDVVRVVFYGPSVPLFPGKFPEEEIGGMETETDYDEEEGGPTEEEIAIEKIATYIKALEERIIALEARNEEDGLLAKLAKLLAGRV